MVVPEAPRTIHLNWRTITAHPEFIADWQMLSEDKRCDGWFWRERSSGGFELGYIPEKQHGTSARFAGIPMH